MEKDTGTVVNDLCPFPLCICGYVQRFGELVTTATAKAKEQIDLKVLNLLVLLVQKYKY